MPIITLVPHIVASAFRFDCDNHFLDLEMIASPELLQQRNTQYSGTRLWCQGRSRHSSLLQQDLDKRAGLACCACLILPPHLKSESGA